MLYAQDRWSLLLVFQAMDAAGKDSTIKHVMSGVIRRGAKCSLSSSPRQRSSITTSCGVMSNACPNVVAIGIFNRSYYEEVLVVRVHPEILARQKLPERYVGKEFGMNGWPTLPILRITSRGRAR